LPGNRLPSPWWNHTCAEAIEKRSALLRMYKSNPSWDNWIAYKHEKALCRKTLKREKRNGWKQLCSEFTYKTPTPDIWRFIKAYKNKSLSYSNSSADYNASLEAQDLLLGKLCPPSCLHKTDLISVTPDNADPPENPFAFLDNPFTFKELEMAIYSSKIKSSPGLDRFDYKIIRAIPTELLAILLEIFNELFAQGLFPDSWKSSLIIFVPKPGGKGVRPIALLSCFLKLFEKMVYRRLQWAVETQFLLPDF